MRSPNSSTEGEIFRSQCGREYESELDRDRHEGQCEDCIDINHGQVPEHNAVYEIQVDPNDSRKIVESRSWKSHRRRDVNIRVPAAMVKRFGMDQHRFKIAWVPEAPGRSERVILCLYRAGSYRDEPVQGG